MIDAFIEYLKIKSAPASSLELAQKVLKISTEDERIADKIILPLLKNSSRIELCDDHMWTLAHSAEAPAEPHDMVLCTFFPEKTDSIYHWLQAGCTAVSNGRITAEKIFSLRDGEIERGFHDLLRFTGSKPLLFDGFGNQISLFHYAVLVFNGTEFEQPLLSLKRLLKQAYPQEIIRERAQVAEILGLAFYESDDIKIRMRLFVEEFQALMQVLHSRDISNWNDFIHFYQGVESDVDYSPYAFDRNFIDTLPPTPGVYIMRDRDEKVIYVGKARNLASRIKSYFQNSADVDEKTRRIRARLYQIEIEHSGSEMEALLAEQKYIGQFHPPINKQIQIQDRVHKKKSRYERIILLPSHKQAHLRVYVLSSEYGVQPFELEQDLTNFAKLLSLVRKTFFGKSKRITKVMDKNLEIVTSWLSLHEDEIHSIDMRKIATIKDAERILRDQVKSYFQHSDKVIHY